jgi:hypothetical protein
MRGNRRSNATLMIFIGLMGLLALWVIWGVLVLLAAQTINPSDPPSTIQTLGNYADTFAVLASLVTSTTVITAAIQLLRGNEDTRQTMRLLEGSTRAQSLISRSGQIDLLFESYINSYIREVESGIDLWGKTCRSMTSVRHAVTEKYKAKDTDPAWSEYYRLIGLPESETRDHPDAAVYRRAASAMSHELQHLGLKCMAGAIPTGVLLSNMNANYALQWVFSAPLVHLGRKESGTTAVWRSNLGQPFTVHYSRRHGLWLAIASALYCLKQWPDGLHAGWARQFLDVEFQGSIELARTALSAIYRCDEEFFERNDEVERLIASL